MSFVATLPELISAAAGRLQVIGSEVTAANATAAFPITGIVPAAEDEVSAVTAAVFSGYGRLYHAFSAEAAVIHEQFVNALGLSASSYAATEAANAKQAGGGMMPGVPAAPAHLPPGMRTVPARPASPTAPAHPVPPARPASPTAPAHPAAPAGGHPATAAPAAPVEHAAPAHPAPVAPAERVAPARA